IIIIPVCLIASFSCLALIFKKIRSLEQKTKKMKEISTYIEHGATVYLKRQARMFLVIGAILCVPIGFTGIEYLNIPIAGFFIAIAIFFFGSASSLFAGYIGMKAATKTNILVVEASFTDPQEGFKLSYYGGMITGILNISMFVLGTWILLFTTQGNVYLMVSYDFGASVAALLAQVGGGIFTKSADMGADLVGKYELSIDEDDPRNPAIIADLVGDNVGDCAGRGADLFESASSDVIGGMLLGITIFLFLGDPKFVISNLTLISLGLFSLFFTTLFLKVDLAKPSKSIWRVFIASVSFNFVVLFVINLFLFGPAGIYLFFASAIGLISAFAAILLTTYYTSVDHKPTRKVAEASKDSPSLNIVAGIATGFSSTFVPIVVFCVSVILTFVLGKEFGILFYEANGSPSNNILGSPLTMPIVFICFGIWGVNMASVSSDTIISTILSFDTFGPIMDNAAGIAEMGREEAPKDLRSNLDRLDALGNTTKAVAKGFALICGGFSSIVMFLTFLTSTQTLAYDLSTTARPLTELKDIFNNLDFFDPLIIMGIFVGVILPFLFSSMVLRAVRKGAENMVKEVRHQFKSIPGLKEGAPGVKPDYDECIDISASNALKKIVKPVLFNISFTILLGILFGPIVVAGILIGNLIGCLILGFFMSIGGAAFDNAKKAIESGLFGGKGSFAHKSAIIGDTVGDPLKDSAGPSMNILITTMNTMALTFLPLFILTGFLGGLFSAFFL
ncbi:MAG: sodium-translocating pyrophosphatase, partial [Candidatus Lokiarchaeota archaeon]|nr:sodium-translocating pyrophosphatase [Candidatus Lokiarchaeota archaeon]